MKNLLLKRFFSSILLICLFLLVSACSSMVSSTTNKLAENLSHTILNSDDPQTVADGAPAYLLLMDSLLIDSADNPTLLQSSATLYSAYASVFVTDHERAARMSNKALGYAEQALCLTDKALCNIRQLDFTAFTQQVSQMQKNDLQPWFVLGSTWAGWIQSNSGSMSAIADLPKVNLIMERIIELDENWKNGSAHLYLGVLKTLIPPAFGGKPEQARQHFERAIELSNGHNLMVKVLFAETYARLVFNQTLHDELLNEVIQSDPYHYDLTLMNTLAKTKARVLLDSSIEYF